MQAIKGTESRNFRLRFAIFRKFHPIFILVQAPTTPLSEAYQRQRGVVVWVGNTSLVGQELIERDLAVTLSSTRMLSLADTAQSTIPVVTRAGWVG